MNNTFCYQFDTKEGAKKFKELLLADYAKRAESITVDDSKLSWNRVSVPMFEDYEANVRLHFTMVNLAEVCSGFIVV